MIHPPTKMKRLRTPECYSYKPFQTYNWLYECSLPYKTLKVCKIQSDMLHPHFEYFVHLLLQTTYLKIGASICRSSFTKHLHLGACMILNEQNCLRLSNTLQSRYYIRGLCSGRHFLTVASHDPCAAERG